LRIFLGGGRGLGEAFFNGKLMLFYRSMYTQLIDGIAKLIMKNCVGKAGSYVLIWGKS